MRSGKSGNIYEPIDIFAFFGYNGYRNDGTYCGEAFDLIIGAVANDDVYRTLQVYSAGLLTEEQALEALRIKKLFNQYVFASNESLALLRFMEAREV